MDGNDELARRIAALSEEHRDLDAAIESLGREAFPDQVRLQRLKKRKLRIRDELVILRDGLRPDIIA